MNTPATRVLMLASFGAYAFIYIPGVVLLALDIKLGNSEWVSGLLLILAGISAAMWVVVNRGLKRGLIFAASILVLSYLIEYLGVASGLIFGPYRYTEVLVPLISLVPLAIPFAWLTVVLGSWYVANTALPTNPAAMIEHSVATPAARQRFTIHHPLAILIFAGLLTMLLDLLIEPVAVYVSHFWAWSGGGLYYGVPLQNFVAWWLVGILMAVIAGATVGNLRGATFTFLPPLLYLSNAFLFGVVSLTHGYYVTALLAVVALFFGLRGFILRSAR